ncbi:MAG: M15 family metallopeptidase [Bacilli bacterium]
MRKRKKAITLSLILIGIIILLAGGIYLVRSSKKEDIRDNNSKPNPTLNNKDENNKIVEKLKLLNNINKSIDYFKMEYLDRYVTFKQNHSNLTNEDVVTRVNLNLDKPAYTNTKDTPYLNQIYLLSNKYISMPSTYIPKGLEVISSTYSNGSRQLVKEAKEAFEEMALQAKKEGFTIRAMSTYRSYKYQVTLYQNYVDQDGKEKADTYSARAGFSEHQTGLVADIDNKEKAYTSFHLTKEFTWMKNNAYKFGFILRYPKGKEEITGYGYESWHYRYVGVPVATYIHEHDITFDEYYAKFIDGKK